MFLRFSIISAAIFGLTGVALGAFGAHALHGTSLANGTLNAWKTGVHYQMVHAVALFGGYNATLLGLGSPILGRRRNSIFRLALHFGFGRPANIRADHTTRWRGLHPRLDLHPDRGT